MCDEQWASVVSSLHHRFVRHREQLEKCLIFEQYISIHARHSDFGEYCGDLPQDQCFASPAIIGRRIEEVRQELRERKNMEVQHIVMTSDERNATWWEDIKKQGWLIIDHSQTVELYGHW